MKSRPEDSNLIEKKQKKKKWIFFCMVVGLTLLWSVFGLKIYSSDNEGHVDSPKPIPTRKAKTEAPPVVQDDMWDGPVLYCQAGSKPFHIILVEKAIQKMHLYRYDGGYHLIKSYDCATGEKRGKKRQEKDEKTPEGIYFNVKTYRDSEVTIFGDRAFGLNYPDAFDKLDGNQGNGIFIHGSNKAIGPFSTNGCIVLNNSDLAELDQRIEFSRTPVIIGAHLPYRFGPAQRNLSELASLLKKAMVPEDYAHLSSDFSDMAVLGFENRVVAMGQVHIKAANNLYGLSRLYLADAGQNLLVLLRREWQEEKPELARAQAKPKPISTPKDKDHIVQLVESWRRAWEGKQLNAYIAHYHPDFKNDGKDLVAWKQYKGRLNQRYRSISVKVSDLKVRVNGNTAMAYFKQRYRSDAFSAQRYKRLEFRKKGDSWKIFRERTFVRKQAGWPT
jgi:murein L,D-transpeptidase YafK